MSKSLPQVSTTAVPLAGAVQRYQTEAPPSPPGKSEWAGSPACLVAPSLVPAAAALVPASACELSKSSFAGGGELGTVTCLVNEVASPPSSVTVSSTS